MNNEVREYLENQEFEFKEFCKVPDRVPSLFWAGAMSELVRHLLDSNLRDLPNTLQCLDLVRRKYNASVMRRVL